MRGDRGFVYFIACAELKAMKIGFTTGNPWARVSALQTGCAAPLDLIAYVEGTMDEEREFHRVFDPIRLQGEWFSVVGKLDDFFFYVSDYARQNDKGRRITRQQLDAAIWDCCIIGLVMPGMDEEAHNATADLSPWAPLVAEHRQYTAEFDAASERAHGYVH